MTYAREAAMSCRGPSRGFARYGHFIDRDGATRMIDTGGLTAALRELKLSGMLDARLVQARAGEFGHLESLQVLCEEEISRRQITAMSRRLRRAPFEQQTTFEAFDFTANPKSANASQPAGRWSSPRTGNPPTGTRCSRTPCGGPVPTGQIYSYTSRLTCIASVWNTPTGSSKPP